MPDAARAIADLLGPDASAIGHETATTPDGRLAIAYVQFRGVQIAAAAPDRERAAAMLLDKLRRHEPALRALEPVPAVVELNLVADLGLGRPVRRFVRPLSRARAALELELGVDGALVFVDAANGRFAVVARGPGGVLQTTTLGEPVLGDEPDARPLPIPGRTPPADAEPALRADKARRLRPLLRCPVCRGELDDRAGALACGRCAREFPSAGGSWFLPVDPAWDPRPRGAVSQNPYGQQVLSLIEANRDAWVLDCGSGSPTRGFHNVVHLDLFSYPTVDVVTDGRALPFADASFAAVLSEAVLEHVPDPVGYLREVARVMRPGALVQLDAAFLQPYHGYPDHYFNMTRSGLRHAVEQAGLEVVALAPNLAQQPFVTLGLVLNGFVAGITEADARERFLGMTIGAAIEQLGRGGGAPFDRLTADAIDRLAAGFACLARKP
jgi:hypothetical protein